LSVAEITSKIADFIFQQSLSSGSCQIDLADHRIPLGVTFYYS